MAANRGLPSNSILSEVLQAAHHHEHVAHPDVLHFVGMLHELDEGLVEVLCPAFGDVGVLPLLSKPVGAVTLLMVTHRRMPRGMAGMPNRLPTNLPCRMVDSRRLSSSSRLLAKSQK